VSEKIEENKMAAKEQRLFRRILGLFLILYGFLVLSQPSQYGLGFSSNQTPLLGFGLVVIGFLLVLIK
jgi:hypothetical protein